LEGRFFSSSFHQAPLVFPSISFSSERLQQTPSLEITWVNKTDQVFQGPNELLRETTFSPLRGYSTKPHTISEHETVQRLDESSVRRPGFSCQDAWLWNLTFPLALALFVNHLSGAMSDFPFSLLLWVPDQPTKRLPLSGSIVAAFFLVFPDDIGAVFERGLTSTPFLGPVFPTQKWGSVLFFLRFWLCSLERSLHGRRNGRQFLHSLVPELPRFPFTRTCWVFLTLALIWASFGSSPSPFAPFRRVGALFATWSSVSSLGPAALTRISGRHVRCSFFLIPSGREAWPPIEAPNLSVFFSS